MRKYDIILFDLDGTLVDSGEGIMRSVQYALSRFGIEVADYSSLRRFVGPPLEDSFSELYGFGKEDALKGVEYYREYYFGGGIKLQTPYQGVEEFLHEVKRLGCITAVATSKNQRGADYVCRELFPQFRETIDYVFARDHEGRIHTKAEVIGHGLATMAVADRSRVLMVGDRKYDIIGAKGNGLDSAGVLWGFGDRTELETAGADYIAGSFNDLLEILN